LDTRTERRNGGVPLWIVLIVPLALLSVAGVTLSSVVTSVLARRAVREVTGTLRRHVDSDIQDHVQSTIETPLRILEEDARTIATGGRVPWDQGALQARFLEQVRLFPTVSSIYFGNDSGGLADAGREGANGSLYVMGTDGFAAGTLHKWGVDEAGNAAGELQRVAGFDARRRPWFSKAVAARGTTWSGLYQLSTGQEIAIAAARPVRDSSGRFYGVVAVDLFISQVRDVFQRLDLGGGGFAFMVDGTGALVACSVAEPNAGTGSRPGQPTLIGALKSGVPVIRAAAAALASRGAFSAGSEALTDIVFVAGGASYHMDARPLRAVAGLDWVVATVLPSTAYMGPVEAAARVTVLALALILLLAVGLSIALAQFLIVPVGRLGRTAHSLAGGDFSATGLERHWIREVRGLAGTFDSMAGRLASAIEELRGEVRERGRSEVELRHARERLEFILASTNTRLDIIDESYELQYVDPEWHKVYGDPRGRKCYQYFLDGLSVCPGCPLVEVFRTGKGMVTERALPREGDRPVLVTSIPFRDEVGRLMVAEATVDLRERKRLEGERLELERRLLHAQKLESLGILAGGIAHDFNNLLMVISGNLDLAMDTAADADTRESIRDAAGAARAAADLTRLMLAYSGKGRILPRATDLAALVRESTPMFQSAVGRAAMLDLQVAPQVSAIKADRAQVQQVIMNLLTNSSESLEGGSGTVRLSVGERTCTSRDLEGSLLAEKPAPGRFVSVEVTDDGCGMSPETLGRLFDPFFTTKAAGRGLGMSVVQGIVRGHGGAIVIDSRPGAGTTVSVLFPALAGPAAPAPSAAPPAETGRPSRTGTILVVDDQQSVRAVSARFLAQLGYRVLEAADGEQAVSVFRAHADEVSLVLLDVTMPRVDGFTAARRILAERPGARIIMCSGFGERPPDQGAEELGLRAFLAKPYRLAELQKAVAEALDGR
jgi:signal transduction histidine kinase/CheY-like chemotaxis protein